MRISVCIPTWNRYEYTIKAIDSIIDDYRISEIVITDDNSTDGSFERITDYYSGNIKVKLFKNENRKKVHGNKRESIFRATCDYVILLDSDNTIDKSYIDTIESQIWQPEIILQPSFAKPNFDYRGLTGTYDKENIKEYCDKPLFDCMLNTQNFFVNRNMYLSVWQDEPEINGADSIFFNYLWLQAGNKIKVLEGLEYNHEVHRGSFYESVADESLPKCQNILQKIKSL